jgi:hypothetical protein
MSTVFQDHHVEFRYEESLGDTALEWRRAAGNENDAYFNIVRFVLEVLATKLKKGPLHIKFFERRANEKPAYVTYDPLTLHIDVETWELADLGEPAERFVVAHEVGHLILHDHDAKAFLNDASKYITFGGIGHSAEWQANVFASYLLVPNHVMAAYCDFDDLSKSCGTNDLITRSRYELSATRRGRAVVRDGSLCVECGNLSVASDGRCKSTICAGRK